MTKQTASRVSLAIRSILMTMLFPGFVVGLVPFAFILDNPRFPTEHLLASHYGGLFMILLGLAVLLRSIWEFAHYGRGTLAPFDEPQKLVIKGLYRYVRNPMYVGVYSILLGEAMFFKSADILIWFIIFFVASNAVVMLFEEPNLTNKYGVQYTEYCQQVHRWIPGKPFQIDELRNAG